MTLGDFQTLTSSLPTSTPLVIAVFDPSPHASPQYIGLPISGVMIQNMVQIGSLWDNPRDPAYRGNLPQVQVIFINPQYPSS